MINASTASSPSSGIRSEETVETGYLSADAKAGAQQLSNQRIEDRTDLVITFTMQLQQPQPDRSRALELENKDLSRKLVQTQQENKLLETRFESCKQIIESQEHEIAEKSALIEQLQSRLARLADLSAAFTDEVHYASSAIEAANTPYVSLYDYENKHMQQEAADLFMAAPGSSRGLINPHDNQQQKQSPQQHSQKAAASMPVSLQLPAAVAALSRLQPLQTGLVPSAAVVVEAAAEAAAGGAAGSMRLLPGATIIGSKRARLCSATGSGGDATAGGLAGTAATAAALKRAASGGSGSSSSRQQMSDEHEGDEVDGDDATAGCMSAKSRRSPGSSELVQTPVAEQQHRELDEEEDEGEDKSQDDLDAAQCLQQLRMSSITSEVQGSTQGVRLPTAFDTLSNSERFGGGSSHVVPASRSISMSRWTSLGQHAASGPAAPAARAASATLPAAAGIGFGGSSSSSASGGLNPFIQAHLMGYLQGQEGGFEGFPGLPAMRQQGQQVLMPSQQKKQMASNVYLQQQQQPPKPLHHYGSGGARRADSVGASGWTAGMKGAAAGNMAAPVRTRKQSWFQTEIAGKIPLSVQQACSQDWSAQQCMQVVCADLCGTFYVNSAGEYLIKLASNGEVVTPNKFEELAGKKTARNWQQSIRLVGYTMNGEANSALLKLGHFTRIVGLVQDR